jgi:hypothetical protein
MGVPPLLTLTTYIISFIFQYYLTLGFQKKSTIMVDFNVID